jgi:malate permease and related proteins
MRSIFDVLYNVIVPVFLTAAIGFWFAKRFKPTVSSLSRAAIYIFMPCLIFQSIATSQLEAGELGRLVILIVLMTGIMYVVGWGIAQTHASLGRATQSAILLSVVLVNAGNFGLPLIEFAFGADGSQRGVIIATVMSVITNTVGVYLASLGSASVKEATLNILKTPLPYAVVLGILVNVTQITLPVPIVRTVSTLGQAAVPLLLVLLGVQLASVSLRSQSPERSRAIVLCTAVRLVLSPLLLVILTGALGITGLTQKVAIVQLSLPTAVNAALFAAEFGSDAPFVSTAIMVSTLTSVLTLSVLLSLIG